MNSKISFRCEAVESFQSLCSSYMEKAAQHSPSRVWLKGRLERSDSESPEPYTTLFTLTRPTNNANAKPESWGYSRLFVSTPISSEISFWPRRVVRWRFQRPGAVRSAFDSFLEVTNRPERTFLFAVRNIFMFGTLLTSTLSTHISAVIWDWQCLNELWTFRDVT